MRKLSEYAMNIPEQEYHESRRLSYSILARYEREGGFTSLPAKYADLWAPIQETDALTFGAALDTLVTRGPEAYEEEFIEADIRNVTPKTKAVVEQLVRDGVAWSDTDGIIKVMDGQKYYPTWRPATRISKMMEDDGQGYYETLMSVADTGKRVISKEMAALVQEKYLALKDSPLTDSLLFGELPEGRERFFQLQFTTKVDGIDFKIMCDMVIVDHKRKTIHIYDLKTTGKESSDFKRSYLEWQYHIQSWLYRIVLRHALMFTDYEDYTVGEFSFIVVSKVNSTPLVYDDETQLTHARPWLRDPLDIAREIEEAYADGPDGEKARKDVPGGVDPEVPVMLTFTE